MLKKLLKYGNSNALVLGKAILELLNITEGSILKISNDGTSITPTPQKKIELDKVNETHTNEKAHMDDLIDWGLKGCDVSVGSKN
jgi:antitoxin component of MazEF toxin-antitoxin module